MPKTTTLSIGYLFPVLCLLSFHVTAQKNFDKQSHRGGAGLMPENTIAAAKNALKLGTTIEMDLYMSKDSQLVVTHDPHIMTKYYHSLIRFQQCAQKNKKEKLFKISPFRHLSS